MRVTKSKLKNIIQEELQNILKEHPMPHAHRHREDPLDPLEATLETTLWPLEGDLVYPALGNLPASMYGPGGTGPEAQYPYGHYGTDPALEWPTQWAPVPLIPGLTPEETAAFYHLYPGTGDPISHTPNVGIEDPGFIPESLQKIIQEELQKVLQEQELDPRFTDPATLGTGARLMPDPRHVDMQVAAGRPSNMLPNLPKELRGPDYVPWAESVPSDMLPNLPWQEDNPDYVPWAESVPSDMLPNLPDLAGLISGYEE